MHIKLAVHSTSCTHAYSAFITQFYMYLQAYNTREREVSVGQRLSNNHED